MVLPSLGTGLSQSSVNTADCASHFLCEENHKQAQLHLHEKPHRPTNFPQVSLDQKYIGFPASYIMAKIAICFLNFRIIVDKSISQPLVIGAFFFCPKNDFFYSFSRLPFCSALWQLLLFIVKAIVLPPLFTSPLTSTS